MRRRSIKGLDGEFLKGINIHAGALREFPIEIIEFLRRTPIDWVRVHPLPSRKIRDKSRSGISYLDAIGKLAQAGFNLVVPIDVGLKENVGAITAANMRKFVDDSYSESFKAVKQIETRINGFKRNIIYGVENELDTKEWILQSLPTVGWRESSLAWLDLSVNKELKYKRLRYIFEGIKEASPDSLTMINFEADDPSEDGSLAMSFIIAAQAVLSKLGIFEKNAQDWINNFRLDISEALSRLNQIDIVGLDSYPNYFTKFPPKGSDIGPKVNEIAHLTHKPIINSEFGYTTSGRRLKPSDVFPNDKKKEIVGGRRNEEKEIPSPEELQRHFFDNALASIENSSSQGTFPWVLLIDPIKRPKPVEEIGFRLSKLSYNRALDPVPALEHYTAWLDLMSSRELGRLIEKKIWNQKQRDDAAHGQELNKEEDYFHK
ncbi:MAG: hypothetical protein ACREBS_03220 [Nitrososphaerales archaeon]